jgi:hypothetical protein
MEGEIPDGANRRLTGSEDFGDAIKLNQRIRQRMPIGALLATLAYGIASEQP